MSGSLASFLPPENVVQEEALPLPPEQPPAPPPLPSQQQAQVVPQAPIQPTPVSTGLAGMLPPVSQEETAAPDIYDMLKPVKEPTLANLLPETISIDEARADPELLSTIRRYAGNVHKQTFEEGPKGDDAAFDWWSRNRVWNQDANTMYMLGELNTAMSMNDDGQGRQDLAKLRDTWNRVPAGWQEGGRGVWPMLRDNVPAAVLDPTNLAGFGVGKAVANRAVNFGVNRVVGNIAGQALADGAISAGQNALGQGANISLGSQTDFRPGQMAQAGAIGVAAGTALGTAAAGIGAGSRAIANSSIGERASEYRQFLAQQLPDLSQTLDRASDWMPTMARAAPEARDFRVFDRQGTLLGSFDNRTDAKAAAKANGDALVQEFKSDSPLGLGPVRSFINEHVDSLFGTEKLGQLYNSTGNRTAEQINNFNPHVFDVNIAQNADKTASIAIGKGGGQFRFSNNRLTRIKGSESLEDVLSRVGDAIEVNHIANTRMAMRLLNIEKGTGRQNPLSTGISAKQRADAEILVGQYVNNPQLQARWKPHMDALDRFDANHNLLMQDLNMYSPEMRQLIEGSNIMYLPIHRVVADGAGNTPTKLGGSDRTRAAMKGKEADLDAAGNEVDAVFLDPMRNYAKNIQTAIQVAIRNQSMAQKAQAITSLPGELSSVFGRMVDPKLAPKKFGFEQVNQAIEGYLKNANIPGKAKDEILYNLRDAQESMPAAKDFFAIWASQGAKQFPENVIPFYENGQMKYLQVTNPDLMRSVSAYKKVFSNANVLGQAAQMLQYAITRTPDFIIGTSLFQDPITAAVGSNSKRLTDFLPLYPAIERLFKGGAELAKRDEALFQEATANGVLYSGINSASNTGAAFKWLKAKGIETNNIFGFSRQQDQNLWQRILPHVLQGTAATKKYALDTIPDVVESAPRLAELRIQQKELGNTASANYQTIENNIDFRRGGASQWSAEFFRTVPFLRAGNNIIYKLTRQIDFTPADFFEGKVAGQKRQTDNLVRQAKVLSTVALPVIGLAIWNRDNPEYQGLPDEQRKLFFHFWTPDGTHYQIRKDDGNARFANIIEYGMNLWQREDKNGYQAFRDAFLAGAVEQLPAGRHLSGADPVDIMTAHLPMGVKQGVDLALNNGVGRSQIIARDLEKIEDTKQQYREGVTSPLARYLNDKFPLVPPVVVDYLGSALMGPVYGAAADISKAGDPNFPSRGVEAVPVARRFMRELEGDLRRADWGNRLREYFDEATSAKAGSDIIQKRGRTDSLNEARLPAYNARTKTLTDLLPRMTATQNAVNAHRQQQGTLLNNPNLSPEQKKRMFDAYTQTIYLEQYAMAKYVERKLGETRY